MCHEWNTVAHLNDYEGRPERRPLTYDEVQRLFDYLDDRVERIALGRKGAFGALRDAQMFKTAYAFGLRRNELSRLDVADLRPNPHVPEWGTYGSVHVRYGKAIAGGVPRRRTVLAVPEFDWVIEGMRQWVERGSADLPRRRSSGAVAHRTTDPGVDPRLRQAVRMPARPGLDPALRCTACGTPTSPI